MAYFHISSEQKPNRDHEVHRESCDWLPISKNRVYLGAFDKAAQAVTEARRRWPHTQINGCPYCCPEEHTPEPTT